LPFLKEWAYAGAAFAWVMAIVAHYSAADGVQIWSIPLVLLVLLIVSYVTRPASPLQTNSQLSEANFQPVFLLQ